MFDGTCDILYDSTGDIERPSGSRGISRGPMGSLGALRGSNDGVKGDVQGIP